MKKIRKLTKKEEEIIRIFWKNDKPLSATQAVELSDGESVHTVHQAIRRMLEDGIFEVVSVGQNKKALMRLFKPTITEAEYYSQFLSDKCRKQLALDFISQNTDLDTYDELKKALVNSDPNIKTVMSDMNKVTMIDK